MSELTHLSDISFQSLGLHPLLQQSIDDAGFTHCTPIQAQTLPLALQGKDIAGQAQTGTGKTAAFLLAAMQRLLTEPPMPGRNDHQPRVLVLAPTRELAVQIHKDALLLGKHAGLRCVVVYGGAGYDSQREAVRAGVDILIGTPGRVIDYFKQNVFDLKAAQAVILDEADRMFDLGFIADIRYLLRRCPPPGSRQNLLFSATLSQRVLELAFEHMNDPLQVRIEPEQVTAERVRQSVYYVANDEKIQVLIGVLRHMDPHRTLLFVNTKSGAEFVRGWLEGNGFNAEVLSGDVPQPKRLRLLAQFTGGELPILVATDVAARGLHIPDVSHVINFDLPQDAEDYVHRIGRTARAGASGDAISLACETHAFVLPDIERYIGQKIPQAVAPAEWLVKPKPPIRRERPTPFPGRPGGRGDGRGGRGGGRGRGGPGGSSHGHKRHDRGH